MNILKFICRLFKRKVEPIFYQNRECVEKYDITHAFDYPLRKIHIRGEAFVDLCVYDFVVDSIIRRTVTILDEYRITVPLKVDIDIDHNSIVKFKYETVGFSYKNIRVICMGYMREHNAVVLENILKEVFSAIAEDRVLVMHSK